MKRPQLVAYSIFYFIAVGAIAGSVLFPGAGGSILLFLGNVSFLIAMQVSLHGGPSSRRKARSLAAVTVIVTACVAAVVLIVWSGVLDYALVRYGLALALIVYASVEWRRELPKWDVT